MHITIKCALRNPHNMHLTCKHFQFYFPLLCPSNPWFAQSFSWCLQHSTLLYRPFIKFICAFPQSLFFLSFAHKYVFQMLSIKVVLSFSYFTNIVIFFICCINVVSFFFTGNLCMAATVFILNFFLNFTFTLCNINKDAFYLHCTCIVNIIVKHINCLND